jgi:hypothetical protein
MNVGPVEIGLGMLCVASVPVLLLAILVVMVRNGRKKPPTPPTSP